MQHFQKRGAPIAQTGKNLFGFSIVLRVNRGSPARSHGSGRSSEGTSRIEIRKLPFFCPTTSNRAKFSAPPLLMARTGLPPESSAISGERFRASSAIFAVVPRTRTVTARCSPGFNGEESASRLSPTNVMEAQETSRSRCRAAGPGKEARPAPLAKTLARSLAAPRSSLGWSQRLRRSPTQKVQPDPSRKPRAARMKLRSKSTRPRWARESRWPLAPYVPKSNHKSRRDSAAPRKGPCLSHRS